jgi:Orange carotenoid protein, N-terminal
MTSTGTNSTQQAVNTFQHLDTNNQLLVLASVYLEIKNSLSTDPASTAGADDVNQLVHQVKEMRQENQLEFLQDVLRDRQTDSNRVELDPHPSKAMLELVPGVKPPLSRYRELDKNSRLAFWYCWGRELEGQIASIAQQPNVSDAAKEVVAFLNSSNLDEKIAFLNHVI